MKVIYDEIYLWHSNADHIENSDRLRLLLEEIPKTEILRPKNGVKYLDLCHVKQYISTVKNLKGRGNLNADTYYNDFTYKAACYAVGGSIKAAEKQAFALTRPPGHHALKDRAMGFCIFGNMAITAKYFAEKKKKVAILDIDCHHGNGTQDLVMNDSNILFCSVHQSPFYPGTGLRDEGNAINFPVPAGTGDEAIIKLMEERFVPALKEFEPDYIGVSAGFDSYEKDHTAALGNDLNMTTVFYEWVAQLVENYKHFFLLEGGYIPQSVSDGVKFFMERL